MGLTASNRYLAQRPAILGLAKILLLSLHSLSPVQAAPLWTSHIPRKASAKKADDADLWLNLGIAAILVLLGGAFAGLTIALMGQVRQMPFIEIVAVWLTPV